MRKLLLYFFFYFGIIYFSNSQGMLSGIVYQDINQNGAYDTEAFFGGIKVELYNSSNILVNTTFTSSTGMIGGPNYSFTNLSYGPYTVKFTATTNYRFSSAIGLIVNNNTNPATATSSMIFVTSTSATQNAGIYFYTPPTLPPTVQVTNLAVSNIQAKTVALSWTRGNGNGVIIIGREGAPVSKAPIDDHFYNAFYGYGLGEDLGNGNYVLYKGTGNNTTITDLKQLTQYYFTAYEYNTGNSSDVKHLFSNPTSANATTKEFSSGKAGSALSFNGIKNCLDQMGSATCIGNTSSSAGQFINNTGVFTIEMWLKLNNHAANACQVLYANGEGAGNKGVFFAYDNRSSQGRTKQLICELYNGSGTKIISSVSPANIITDNEWHHIAFTGDGTNINFYVDGVQFTGSGTMGTKSTGNWTYNGGYFGVCPYTACVGGDINYQYWLNGIADELRFWNITRTPQEIKNNMNLILTGDEAGLKGYLQFNEGTPGSLAGFVPDLLSNLGGGGQGGYQPTYVTSEAPVAKGTSFSLNVTSAGTYDFTGTGVKMTFATGGTYPNGELVVTRLKESPVNLPGTSNAFANNYWVVRNYGTNTTFSPIQSLSFDNVGTIPSSSVTDPISNVMLYKRASNASGSSWNSFGGASSINNGTQSVVFNSSNNITSFSQVLVGFFDTALPVTFSSYNVHGGQNFIQTDWITAKEFNVGKFVISAVSVDDPSVKYIQELKAQNLNESKYSELITNVKPGVYLVDITVYDKDGSITNTSNKSVSVGSKDLSFVTKPFPVPSKDEDIKFSYFSPDASQLWIDILNMNGTKVISLVDGTNVEGLKEVIIPKNILKPGLYFIKTQNEETVFIERIIIE